MCLLGCFSKAHWLATNGNLGGHYEIVGICLTELQNLQLTSCTLICALLINYMLMFLCMFNNST